VDVFLLKVGPLSCVLCGRDCLSHPLPQVPVPGSTESKSGVHMVRRLGGGVRLPPYSMPNAPQRITVLRDKALRLIHADVYGGDGHYPTDTIHLPRGKHAQAILPTLARAGQLGTQREERHQNSQTQRRCEPRYYTCRRL
jgi:uncharacterized protein YjhX (UPF0386 family)